MKIKSVALVVWFFIFFVLFVPERSLYANDDTNIAYVSHGFFRILTAVFQIPHQLLLKTMSEPPGIGTVDGALTGTFYSVAELSGGAFEIVRGVVPYAKYLVFFA